MKKFVLTLLVTLIGFVAAKAEMLTGSCGENVTYTLDTESCLLKIEGDGAMSDYYHNYYYNGSNVTSAPWGNYCRKISVVKITAGVTSIGHNAFYGCTGLTSITIPNSVTSIGEEAFYGCTGMTSVTIPNSVTSIGDYAFCSCTSLTSVTIPTSIKNVGLYTFSNVPCEVYNSTIYVHCPSNASAANIPEGIITIAGGAFYRCSSLTSVTIPNGVTSMGESTFYDCSSLTSVTIPYGVTSIGKSTFYGCFRLTSVNIPNSVTSIGNSAFYNCTSLTSLTIGSGVTSIGNSVFDNCYNLQKISINSTTPPTCSGKSTFVCSTDYVRDEYDVYNYATLHVPAGSGEAYSSAYEWRYFKNIKEDQSIDGTTYYTNLKVKQGAKGYVQHSVEYDHPYTVYIGTDDGSIVNAVAFNGIDVTDDVVNGVYTTPNIKGESTISITYQNDAQGVKDQALANVRVYGNDDNLVIANVNKSTDVTIYSTDGKVVQTLTSVQGTAKVPVQTDNVYIVKVGERTYKVAL